MDTEVPARRERAGFGTRLKRYRVAAGLSQEALAERARLSAAAIGAYERGERQAPYRDTVALLAQALGLSPAEAAALEATVPRRRGPPAQPAGVPQLASSAVSPTARAVPGADASVPPFVGRARELALLDRHLAGEGPPMRLLAGEPGIGKSRLLREAATRAARAGWQVLEGGCQRRGGQEPYAPLLGAIKRCLCTRTPAQLRADLRGCAWLVRLLPELADGPIEPLPAWTAPPEQERRLMYEAVARFLANVPGPERGTLLLLDDLQWAGSDALDMLVTLVRSPASGTREGGLAGEGILRVVGAYRDTEVKPRDPLSVALADLAHAGLATHHSLAPLAVEDAARLLDGLLAGSPSEDAGELASLRARVLQRAGGVPFFLVSCAQGLRPRESDGRDDAVPWDVAQGVRQRVAELPERARTVLGAAAVVGRLVPPAILIAASTQPDEEVLAALEVASRAKLLVDEGHAYRFAHDVVREVVETDVGTARRLIVHRRVAAAIERVHASRLAEHHEMLAYHYLQGEAWEQALEYLVKSGDKATAVNAFQEALRLYDQALALCERLGEAARETAATVAQKRGFLSVGVGDFAGAVADFERVHAIASGRGDRHSAGIALAHRGMSEYFAHDFEAAEASFRGALSVAEQGFDDVRLLTCVLFADLLLITDRHAEAAPLLRIAEELAPRIEDPFSRAFWASTGLGALYWSGQFDAACAFSDRWRGAAEAHGEILTLLMQGFFEALARGGRGEYERALALLNRLVGLCDAIGEDFVRARLLNAIGWIYAEIQDPQRALDWNRQSEEVAQAFTSADPEIISNARINMGDNLLALGRLDEAEAHFQAVERVVRQPRPPDRWMLWRYSQHLFHSYGELWLTRDELEKALAYADECLGLAESSVSRKNIVKARRLRAQVFLAQSRQAEAEAELDRALATARQVGNPPQLWKTYLALGDLRQTQGKVAESTQAYRDALRVIEEVAAGLDDGALRQTFLTSPQVQQVRASARVGAGAPLDVQSPPPIGRPKQLAGIQHVELGSGRSARAVRQTWVLKHLREVGTISPRGYAAALGVSVDTALLDLRDLVEHGQVRASGSTKDRRYRLAAGAK